MRRLLLWLVAELVACVVTVFIAYLGWSIVLLRWVDCLGLRVGCFAELFDSANVE